MGYLFELSIIVVYLLGIIIMGIWYSRGVDNFEEFAVAERSYPAWVIMATLSASFIGGGFSLGNAEKVFLFGILNIFALWGFSLKEILVSRYLAPRMDNYRDVLTVGDLMAKEYGNKARIFTGAFAVVFCAGVLGAQVGAMGYIFQVFLDIPQIWGIFIGTGIVILYSTYGGLKAIVFTDIVQFIILIIGIPLTLIIGIHSLGGWGTFVDTIPGRHLSVFSSNHYSILSFIALFLSFMFGEAMIPPYLQRLLVGKNSNEVKKGVMGSALLSIPFFAISGIIGLLALGIKPDLDPNLALPFVIKEVLPIGLRGLVVAGMISIVMSSADSFLHSATISFVHDFTEPIFKKEQLSDRNIIFTRIVNIFVGLIAVIFAVSLPSILDILLYAYNFWAPVILIPLVSAMLGLHTRSSVFLMAGVAGFLTVFIWGFLPEAFQIIDGLVPGIMVNAIVFFTGTYLFKESEQKPFNVQR